MALNQVGRHKSVAAAPGRAYECLDDAAQLIDLARCAHLLADKTSTKAPPVELRRQILWPTIEWLRRRRRRQAIERTKSEEQSRRVGRRELPLGQTDSPGRPSGAPIVRRRPENSKQAFVSLLRHNHKDGRSDSDADESKIRSTVLLIIILKSPPI